MPSSWTEEDSERLAAMIHANSDWFKLRRAWPYLTQSRMEKQLRQLVKRKKDIRSRSRMSPSSASFSHTRSFQNPIWPSAKFRTGRGFAYQPSAYDIDDAPGTTSHLPKWHKKHSYNEMQTKWTPREYCILAACIYRKVSPLHAAIRFHNRSVSAVQSKYRSIKDEMYVEAARIEMLAEEVDDDEDDVDDEDDDEDDDGDDDDDDGDDDDDVSGHSVEIHRGQWTLRAVPWNGIKREYDDASGMIVKAQSGLQEAMMPLHEAGVRKVGKASGLRVGALSRRRAERRSFHRPGMRAYDNASGSSVATNPRRRTSKRSGHRAGLRAYDRAGRQNVKTWLGP